ncbi:MAG: hypothetical protein H2050_15595 [Sphingobium sp.]|uniref:hypothetical protein n=1 Tax=Sphingobium sp. TaxID=1912891 RepID=UPI0017A92EAA|nr:hypothetical protein [Sphingobium sp.]MBA4756249.1 hypothetical protein [Sphingobium sp.]
MTAEIAIINKMAVTLAADSAVTFGNGEQTKVYNSADKIFEGTNHDPIGVMVYNSPEINGVPVEVIVKMYRDRECPGHFSSVFDYAKALLAHIGAMDTPEVTSESNIRALTLQSIIGIKRAIAAIRNDLLKSASEQAPSSSVDDLNSGVDEQIDAILHRQIKRVEALKDQEWAKGITVQEVIAEHGECIRSWVTYLFADEAFSDHRREMMVQLLSWSLLKEYQRDQLTGLVFAGFGQNEIFPSLVSYEVYGKIAGRLKFCEGVRFDVDRKLDPESAIIPFAQKEMVERFMYGLDDEFLQICHEYFDGSLSSLKDNLLETVSAENRAAVGVAIDSILEEFNNKVVPKHRDRLTSEFADLVRSMPKQELAALAESLVHITSLKRKFSAGTESVGGPIDVAMITRAEGLVWVKRKHYFDPALNSRFFSRRKSSGGVQGD